MFTMIYDISIGDYRVGILESVEIKKSVEMLADTAVITLPGAEYNKALEVESKIAVGDKVRIDLGYKEIGIQTEFVGYVQRIGTDNGAITIECEDELYRFRKELKNREHKNIAVETLLKEVISEIGIDLKIDSTYSWKYDKFVISNATGFDVLKKVQEESGADIYIAGDTLHIHPPGEKVGKDVYYDFSANVQKCDLEYRKASDKKVKIVVKALLPDGKTKEIEVGSTGGEKIEIKSSSSDDSSMKSRGEAELKKYSYDGYDGSITTWLYPVVAPSDSAILHDEDYTYKDGKYFVKTVTTTFSSSGAERKVEIGFKLR